jgi:glycosyltransferase involved in cell wall biosynthesis
MRILHVIEAAEGGVSRHVAQVVANVPAVHHVVLPAERIGGFTDTAAFNKMRSAGAELHLMAMRRSSIDLRNAVAAVRVHRLVRRVRPDVVHGHASIGGAAARLGATGTGAARVYTPNGILTTRLALTVERALSKLTDAFIAVSESEADLAARVRVAHRELISVIPNGIELDGFEGEEPPAVDLRRKLGIDDRTPLVGMIARLAPQKAPDLFVRACAQIAGQMPQAHFVLIGEGPLAGLVAREITGALLDDRFLLLRGAHNAAGLLPQFDVFVLSSRYEGGPYAPLEAMRAGIPVVLTDVIGNRDTVAHGLSGLLVPPDDPAAIADAVLRLLADAGLRQRMIDGARRRLRDRFDVRLAGERLSHLYDVVVMKGGQLFHSR